MLRPAIAVRLLAVFSLLLGVLFIFAELFAPTISIQFDSTQVRQEDGFAYVVPVKARSNLLYQLRSDDADRPSASTLRLLEEGKPLGPAHSSHADIRQQGAGRFSHWGASLWFSSSDGTDPKANGRSYSAEGRLSLRARWEFARAAALAAVLIILSLAIRRLAGLNFQSYGKALQRFIALLANPKQHAVLLAIAICVFGVALCGGAVVYGWYDGDTSLTGLGVARFFPVSDAYGYHSCATSIAAAGNADKHPIGDVWCSRRVLYPAMLASLFSITAWNSQLALIAQGALVGAAIATFSLTASSIAGPAAAMAVAALLFFYAWEFVLGLFMTEVLGFALGLCGLTLLLGFCSTRRPWQLLAGTLLVSVALAARAGALFILPVFPLWAFFAFSDSRTSDRVRFFLVALTGALSGPLIQYSMLWLLGADASNTGGNFSASLYGLSTGSRDWSQAYRDFDALLRQSQSEAFRKIYRVAWDNIVERPGIFIGSLAEAGRLYFYTLFDFIGVRRSNEVLTVFTVLGAVRCVLCLHFPVARLILALGTAEILSAPLIIDSGRLRVFAVTVPLRILLCALGVQWALQLLSTLPSRQHAFDIRPPQIKPSLYVATGIGAIMLVLVFAPATPLAALGQLKHIAGLGCSATLTEVVARLAGETQSLEIVAGNSAVESVDPFRITPQRLRNDSRLTSTWFAEDFLRLTPPSSIIRAVDLSNPSAFNVKPLFFRGDITDRVGPHSLCIDEQSFVEVAGVRHYLIKEIKPLADRQ